MFNESEWLRIVFLLADTQSWLEGICRDSFRQLPLGAKKNLFRKNYYLTPASLVHIIERHYYKINRHPGAAKFTIPLPDILHWIREGYAQPARHLAGNANLLRCFDTGTCIGHDQQGLACNTISIITTPEGLIKTAFPGSYQVPPTATTAGATHVSEGGCAFSDSSEA